MYILNIANAIKKMTVNEIRDYIFKIYYKRIGFSKETSYYSVKRQKNKDLQLFVTKLTEKVPDPRNAKEHYQPFLKIQNQ